MNPRPLIHLWLCAMSAGLLLAQDAKDAPLIEPVPPAPEVETVPAELPAQPPPAVPGSEPNVVPVPVPAPGTPGIPQPGQLPLQDTAAEPKTTEEGFIIKDASLNDIFQYLAKNAGRQYFHNAKIAGQEFLVTGHLNEGNPLQQMEELAFMYGLALHTKGNTIYALTQAQLAQLPSTEFHYQLRYLRPTDILKIEEIIKPMLSPTGIVKFEPKTNTIIIIDSAHRIEQARNLLHGIDKAKGQIVVETKILRVTSTAGNRVGVDWSASLGESGTSVNIIRDLNSVFGLDTATTAVTNTISRATGSAVVNDTSMESVTTDTNSPGLVLSPLRMNAVLRALAEGGLATQVSNPTLITEDNEQATISIIDRLPIITTTQTQNTSGGNPTVTEEVRYKIDQSDPAIDKDPDKHREIGISLVVTPTVLPDGTVRMKMRPRSAQIVEEIVSITGNRYPRVSESMVESIARVPDGHSLVVGGFYGAADENGDNKVPILGDVPILNFFFKSKETVKERASLVFVVTPKSYDPTSISANRRTGNNIRTSTTLERDSQWLDPENPGPAHEPNLQRAMRGLQPAQAPYYPREGETKGLFSPSNDASKARFARGRR